MNKHEACAESTHELVLERGRKDDRGGKTNGPEGNRQRHWFSLRLVLGVAFLAAVAVAGAVFAWRKVDWDAVETAIQGLNSFGVIFMMAVLPLAGFPISLVYVIAGARFGSLGGLAVVAGVTAFHLLAAHAIARTYVREPLKRLFERRGHRLPEIRSGEHTSVCLLGVLVPGLPYFVRNYGLAMTEIPWRIYFGICFPVYVIRSYVAILIGDFRGDASQLAVIACVYALKVSVCAWVLWRLRRLRHRQGGHP